jgi:uncharacterized protein YjiK
MMGAMARLKLLLRRRPAALLALLLMAPLLAACRSIPGTGSPWELGQAELLEWKVDQVGFDQDSELEASGLAFVGDVLLVASEKYGSLVVVEPNAELRARVIRIDVPRYSELEGVAVAGDVLYLCDEAHAAVYQVDLDGTTLFHEMAPDTLLEAQHLDLEGIDVIGAKIGFEGIEVSLDREHVYLVLERSQIAKDVCVSPIYTLRIEEVRLVREEDPLEIDLEDCNWRLTDLAWYDGRLLALKTRFPGERYHLIEIDLERATSRLLLDLTVPMVHLGTLGWDNNIEGLAVAEDGSLWLVSDNSVSTVIDDPVPPAARKRTILMRIPARD